MDKRCSQCGQDKSLTEFYVLSKNRATPRPYAACKSCHKQKVKTYNREHPEKGLREKAKRLMRNFGLTEAGWLTLLVLQDSRGAICKSDLVNPKIATDHCHETGRVRGLLCHPCNRGLGHFKDDPTLLRVATTYLEAA